MKKRSLARLTKRKSTVYREYAHSISSKEREEFEDKVRILEADIILLNDTIHEIRKINNQIKYSATQLSSEIKSLFDEDDEQLKNIRNIRKNIEANSQLLSIRMDAYDMMLNPEYAIEDMVVPIDVYRKVDRIRKCLYAVRVEKCLNITLEGHTDRKYRLNNNIELAFFIIFENAIKYSPLNERIKAEFTEIGDNLEVIFTNMGVSPSCEDMHRLTERGFRSSNVLENTSISGSGLGLYLLKQICESNNVDLNIYTSEGSERKYNGIWYIPFNVRLTFKPEY